MTRLARRLFARVFDTPRPAPVVRRPSDVRARLRLQALEGRVVPATTFTVTNADDTGAGSLRQAITDANAAPGADAIAFSNFFNTPRTISLQTALPTINDDLTLTGPGTANLTVRRDPAAATQFRIFNTTNASRVLTATFSGVTVTGGNVAGDGAGIFTSDENVTILDCVITGNTISGTSATTSGGGVAAGTDGTLTIRNSTISGNTASGRGGGIYFTANGSLLLENSTVSGNTQTNVNGGGGVYFYGVVRAGGVTLRNSTITGNTGVSGGGVGLRALTGNVLIENCTITNNVATSADPAAGAGGGGLAKLSGNGTVTVVSSIIAGNTAPSTTATTAADVSLAGAGLITATFSAIGVNPGANVLAAASANNLPYGATLNLQPLANNGGTTQSHALGAGSAALNAGRNASALGYDQRGVSQTRTSGTGTDIGAFEVGPAGAPSGSATATNVTAAGTASHTFTVTYTAGTAINASTIGAGDVRVTGPNGFNQLATFVSVDSTANGPARTATYSITPPGGSWDAADYGTYVIAAEVSQVADTAGAFVPAGVGGTFQAVVPATFTVANTNDAGSGSLRQAVLDANASVGPDTIVFDNNFFGTARTIALTTGELAINDSVTVTGPGVNLLTVRRDTAAATNFRIFNVSGPASITVTLSGMTITGGNPTLATGNGGGNATADGGGVAVGAADNLTLLNAAVTGNTTNAQGGGIGLAANTGLLTVRNSTISGNGATGAGGGIYFASAGSLLLENSTVSGNTSAGEGGGVYFYGIVQAGGLTIRNSTISGNTAGTNGGGIGLNTVSNGTLVIQSSTITANTANGAAAQGGGGIGQETVLAAAGPAPITIVSSIVAGNTNTTGPDVLSAGTVNVNFSAVGSATGYTPSASSGNNLAVGANLGLQPLADNGGPTRTHALAAGSLALNAGSNPANLTTDQRGGTFVRVSGAAADIGAFEVQQATSTAPRVSGTQINGGAAQRSMVTTLSVTFSAAVTFASTPGAAFTLTRSGGGAVSVTATAATVGGVTVVTLNAFTGAETNAGSLNDGRYTLTALASQITVGGQQLDGNGDGTAGDNFTLGPTALFRLYGDATGDARVDNADFFQFRTSFGLNSTNPAFLAFFDVNGDGTVDNADFFQFRTRFGTSL